MIAAREKEREKEGREEMIGMACTKFGSFSPTASKKRTRKTYLVSVIPEERSRRTPFL